MEGPQTEKGLFHALRDLTFAKESCLFGSRASVAAWLRSDIDLAILAPGADVTDWGPRAADRGGGG